jgi:hypothetical protein
MKRFQKEKILKLKKEIQIKNLMIQELLKIITEAKVKVPEQLLKNIFILCGVRDDRDKKEKEKKEQERTEATRH